MLAAKSQKKEERTKEVHKVSPRSEKRFVHAYRCTFAHSCKRIVRVREGVRERGREEGVNVRE